MVKDTMLDHFKDAWSIYDPNATGEINITHFPDLMYSVGAPLGWDESY